MPSKTHPEYHGVDPKALPYVNEFLSLAKERGLKFDNLVTVGFKLLNRDRVVGICNYASNFREIDLDSKYWETLSSMEKTVLVYHELGHCYCDRDHDFGKDKKYGDTKHSRREDGEKEGYYQDDCPLSLMHPVVIDDECFMAHYGEYVQELFDRCDEY